MNFYTIFAAGTRILLLRLNVTQWWIHAPVLSKYQEEKKNLTAELSEIKRRLHNEAERHADVDEFIRRLKSYIGVPELTREMCMELIEFVTVDECPGKYSKEPREIHIYYKLIDKNQSKPTHKM